MKLNKTNEIGLFGNSLILLAVFLILIYQMPILSINSILSFAVYITWGLVMLYLMIKSLDKLNMNFYYLILNIVVYGSYLVITNSMFNKEIFFLREFFLSITMLLVGYLLANYKASILMNIFKVYLTAVLIVCIDAYFNYLSGNLFNDINYIYPFKNSLGIIIVNSILILLVFSLKVKRKKILPIIFISILLFILFALQNRTGLFALALSVLVYLLFVKINKKVIQVTLFIFILIITSVYFIPKENIVFKIMEKGLMLNILENQGLSSWSSSRLYMIEKGFSLFYLNPIFGTPEALQNGFYIESFIVQYMSAYGIIGCLFLLIYTSIIAFMYFKNIKNISNIFIISFLMVIAMSTTALFEQMSPFGPGGVYFINWILIGFVLNYNNFNLEDQ